MTIFWTKQKVLTRMFCQKSDPKMEQETTISFHNKKNTDTENIEEKQ